jgi:hypothetical protein
MTRLELETGKNDDESTAKAFQKGVFFIHEREQGASGTSTSRAAFMPGLPEYAVVATGLITHACLAFNSNSALQCWCDCKAMRQRRKFPNISLSSVI